MSGGPRFRFSPSPTGYFHVGGARTVLFNWLEARRLDGTLILRIEDTDTERDREEWVLGIQDSIHWLGLDWDDHYRQSERIALYAAAGQRLLEGGLAYYCDCSPEAVRERTKDNAIPGYDRHCRDRGLTAGALRFRVPDSGATVVPDVIRGQPSFEHHTIEDFVLVRTNGAPLFILANVVDDIDMAITHVVRGEEHLANTPKYLLVWRALGELGTPAAEPVFAHLPVLVNEKRQKLSKRRPEDRVELEYYQEGGYLPQAMVNYLALLGWAPADGRDFFSLDEMVAEFRLEDVNNSAAFFDQQKLLHFNQHYIAGLSLPEFVAAAGPFLERGPWLPGDFDYVMFEDIGPCVQERVKTLAEVPGMVEFLFVPSPEFDEKDWDKRVVRHPDAAAILTDAVHAFASCEWAAPVLHDITADIGARYSQGLGKAQFPIRVAVTGKAVGPPLFESLAVLGREPAIARLQAALERLTAVN